MHRSGKSVSPVELANRLKTARKIAEFTIDQAARASDLPSASIRAIETGEREVEPQEFMKLVKAYGRTYAELLQRQSFHINLSPKFRSTNKVSQIEQEHATDRLNCLARAEFDLERILGVEKPSSSVQKRPLTSGDARSQGIDAASDLRMRSGIGQSPISDAKWLLESEFGFRVYFDRLPESIYGLYAYHEELGPCTLINSSFSSKTFAMTCTHELGHFVGTRNSSTIYDDLGVQVECRDEVFANAFAEEFMMPANALRSTMQCLRKSRDKFTCQNLIRLAIRWNVTLETMCHRLENLGLLVEGTWNRIRKLEYLNDHIDREEIINTDTCLMYRSRVYFLAAEAQIRGLVTEGALVNMLDIDHISLRKIVQKYMSEEYDEIETF